MKNSNKGRLEIKYYLITP